MDDAVSRRRRRRQRRELHRSLGLLDNPPGGCAPVFGAAACGVGGGFLAAPGVASGVAGGFGGAAAGVAAALFAQRSQVRSRMRAWEQLFRDAGIPGVEVVKLDHTSGDGLRLRLDLPARFPYQKMVERVDRVEVAADLDRFVLAAERGRDARFMWLNVYRSSTEHTDEDSEGEDGAVA